MLRECKIPDKMRTQPALLLDLDHTLFHTTTEDFKAHARPGLLLFLEEMAQMFQLYVFTMGTRVYAHEKCTNLGITHFIPLSRIYAREDTTMVHGHHKKQFRRVLCEECVKHCIAVDDNPSYWNVPSFEMGEKVIQPRTVLRIKRFVYDGKNKDRELYKLAIFLKKHYSDI